MGESFFKEGGEKPCTGCVWGLSWLDTGCLCAALVCICMKEGPDEDGDGDENMLAAVTCGG